MKFFHKPSFNFDLGDVEGLINSVSGGFSSAYKAVNSPSSVPVQGTGVPGRPGFVYGPGGSIQAVNPATGGLLPPVNSTPTTGVTISTGLIIAAVGILGLAFFLAVRK